MTWRRAPDSEQACGHPRYRVLAVEGPLQYRQCLSCCHIWSVWAICGAPWRAA